MKVHILKTKDFSLKLYEEVLEFLEPFSLPVNFVRAKHTEVKYEGEQLPEDFSFEDAFASCIAYRNQNKLPEGDVVVVLTSQKQAQNWFSFYDMNGNLYVSTCNVETQLENIPLHCYCAYEIACNMLQNGMKLDVRNQTHTTNHIHQTPKGCMNDFCGTREQLNLKFQTANICPACYQYALQQSISSTLLAQIKAIGEKVRKEVMTCIELASTDLENIMYDKNSCILYLEDSKTEIKLKPLLKALYVFILKRLAIDGNGISVNTINDNSIEFYDIYNTINEVSTRLRKDNTINSTIDKLREDGAYLSKRISEINKIIKKQLPETIAKYYQVEYINNRYKILLPIEKNRTYRLKGIPHK